ncbi:MATH domain-containing protein [Aphelenchoides fujianensis]|nr:MATH domain-containing protein [Aphelenchoides fujianensis]
MAEEGCPESTSRGPSEDPERVVASSSGSAPSTTAPNPPHSPSLVSSDSEPSVCNDVPNATTERNSWVKPLGAFRRLFGAILSLPRVFKQLDCKNEGPEWRRAEEGRVETGDFRSVEARDHESNVPAVDFTNSTETNEQGDSSATPPTAHPPSIDLPPPVVLSDVENGTPVKEPSAEGTLRLRVRNFAAMRESVESAPAIIGGVSWRLMVRPREDRTGGEKMLGLFLHCCPNSFNDSWTCETTAEFRLVAQRAGGADVCRRTSHTFTHEKECWGYATFVSWTDLWDEANGHSLDGVFEVEVRLKMDNVKNILSRRDFRKKVEDYVRVADLQAERGLLDKAIECNRRALDFCGQRDRHSVQHVQRQHEQLAARKLQQSIERIEKSASSTALLPANAKKSRTASREFPTRTGRGKKTEATVKGPKSAIERAASIGGGRKEKPNTSISNNRPPSQVQSGRLESKDVVPSVVECSGTKTSDHLKSLAERSCATKWVAAVQKAALEQDAPSAETKLERRDRKMAARFVQLDLLRRLDGGDGREIRSAPLLEENDCEILGRLATHLFASNTRLTRALWRTISHVQSELHALLEAPHVAERPALMQALVERRLVDAETIEPSEPLGELPASLTDRQILEGIFAGGSELPARLSAMLDRLQRLPVVDNGRWERVVRSVVERADGREQDGARLKRQVDELRTAQRKLADEKKRHVEREKAAERERDRERAAREVAEKKRAAVQREAERLRAELAAAQRQHERAVATHSRRLQAVCEEKQRLIVELATQQSAVRELREQLEDAQAALQLEAGADVADLDVVSLTAPPDPLVEQPEEAAGDQRWPQIPAFVPSGSRFSSAGGETPVGLPACWLVGGVVWHVHAVAWTPPIVVQNAWYTPIDPTPLPAANGSRPLEGMPLAAPGCLLPATPPVLDGLRHLWDDRQSPSPPLSVREVWGDEHTLWFNDS